MGQVKTDVSIIIVSFNTKSYLKQCLASVYSATSDLTVELFVVDNASTDGSVLMVLAEYPDVHLVINQDNVGFARANNQAILLSEGRYILLLNSDTVVLPSAILALVEFMDAHLEAGAAGGKLLNPDKTFQASFADFPSLMTEFLSLTGLARPIFGPFFPSYPPDQSNSARPVDWTGGACLIVRRAAIERVGLLDEQFFMYSEEVDWCFRMWENGWTVYYVPYAEVIHYGGASSVGWSGFREVLLRKSRLLFFRKHYGSGHSTLLRLMYAIESGAKLAAFAGLAVLLRSRSVSSRVEMQKKVFGRALRLDDDSPHRLWRKESTERSGN